MKLSLGIKKRRILESARALLVKKGISGWTLDDIAKKAGVAKGTLFLHYANKEELLSAAYLDLSDSLESTLKNITESSAAGLQLLEMTAEAVLSYLDTNSDFLLQVGPDRFSGCGQKSCRKLAKRIAGDMGHLSQILNRFSRSSGIKMKDPKRAACVFFGLCRASLLYRLFTDREENLPERAHVVVDFFLNGVRAR